MAEWKNLVGRHQAHMLGRNLQMDEVSSLLAPCKDCLVHTLLLCGQIIHSLIQKHFLRIENIRTPEDLTNI